MPITLTRPLITLVTMTQTHLNKYCSDRRKDAPADKQEPHSRQQRLTTDATMHICADIRLSLSVAINWWLLLCVCCVSSTSAACFVTCSTSVHSFTLIETTCVLRTNVHICVNVIYTCTCIWRLVYIVYMDLTSTWDAQSRQMRPCCALIDAKASFDFPTRATHGDRKRIAEMFDCTSRQRYKSGLVRYLL